MYVNFIQNYMLTSSSSDFFSDGTIYLLLSSCHQHHLKSNLVQILSKFMAIHLLMDK